MSFETGALLPAFSLTVTYLPAPASTSTTASILLTAIGPFGSSSDLSVNATFIQTPGIPARFELRNLEAETVPPPGPGLGLGHGFAAQDINPALFQVPLPAGQTNVDISLVVGEGSGAAKDIVFGAMQVGEERTDAVGTL